MTYIIPQGYFSEITTIHLMPRFASSSRWLLRSVEAMLACKLTLVYGSYHMMMDLQSLVVSDYHESYEHAEVMADFMNCLLPFQHTTSSDFMQSRESYADQSIDMYKEYKHYLELFEGEGFLPVVAKQFCKTVYNADDYYTFKAFSNLNYGVYAETLLLYQFEKMDYPTFVNRFQEISIFERKRKPLNSSTFKLYLKTMPKVVELYKTLLNEYLTQRTFDGKVSFNETRKG